MSRALKLVFFDFLIPISTKIFGVLNFPENDPAVVIPLAGEISDGGAVRSFLCGIEKFNNEGKSIWSVSTGVVGCKVSCSPFHE